MDYTILFDAPAEELRDVWQRRIPPSRVNEQTALHTLHEMLPFGVAHHARAVDYTPPTAHPEQTLEERWDMFVRQISDVVVRDVVDGNAPPWVFVWVGELAGHELGVQVREWHRFQRDKLMRLYDAIFQPFYRFGKHG